MKGNTVHVALLMFGGIVDDVKSFENYSDAYDCVMSFIDVDDEEDNEDVIEIDEDDDIDINTDNIGFDFDFEGLEGTKYEGTTIYTTEIE